LARRKYDPNYMAEGEIGSLILVEMAIKRSVLPPDASDDVIAAWLKNAIEGGLRVRTASSGLTGPLFLELAYVDPSLFPAIEVDWPLPELYIPSAPSTVQVLVDAVQGILRKLERIELDKVVSDFDGLIESTKDKIDQLDMKTINENLVAFLGEIRDSGQRLDEILNNPAIDPSIDDLRATLESARDVAERIDVALKAPGFDKFIKDLEEAGGELSPAILDFRRALQRVDRLIDSQQSAIESAIAELNAALKNIKSLTEDASENPSRILFGDPPPKVSPGGRQ
jgi:hypothetical protein